jgi:hypothetical protein
MESSGETIWVLAFLVKFGALFVFGALVVAVLARSLYELIRNKVHKGHISTPMPVQESVEPGASIKL